MFLRQVTFENVQDYSKSLNSEASYKNKHMWRKTLHFKSSGFGGHAIKWPEICKGILHIYEF